MFLLVLTNPKPGETMWAPQGRGGKGLFGTKQQGGVCVQTGEIGQVREVPCLLGGASWAYCQRSWVKVDGQRQEKVQRILGNYLEGRGGPLALLLFMKEKDKVPSLAINNSKQTKEQKNPLPGD